MDDKLKQIQKLLDAAEGNLHSARNLLREMTGAGGSHPVNPEEKAKNLNIIEEGKIIEGVYTGENMIGPDGKEFPVPANYASKSKLVEGDVLKLTIADDGSFIFKQIKPIDRRNTIGTLSYSGGNYSVNAEGKSYKVLQASVTYYRGEPGDQAAIILPRDHESSWAAVENIIKSDGTNTPAPDNSVETPDPAPVEKEVKTDDTVDPVESALEEEKTPERNKMTGELVIEPLESPAEDDGPKIELPKGGLDAELAPGDKDILAGLSQEPATPAPEVPETPAETVKPTEAPKVDDNNANKGIKELDI